jgi:hypothetical protein
MSHRLVNAPPVPIIFSADQSDIFGGYLLVMGPHADDFDDPSFFQDLKYEPVVDIDPAGYAPAKSPTNFSNGGGTLKGFAFRTVRIFARLAAPVWCTQHAMRPPKFLQFALVHSHLTRIEERWSKVQHEFSMSGARFSICVAFY